MISKNEDTALIKGAKNGNSKCVKVLIKAGADVNATNGLKKSALHYASEKDFDVCLKLLTEGGGGMAIINSLLRMTSERGKARCMKVLVDAGADVNQRAEKRHTILTLAAKNGHYECMNILINAGADVNFVNGFNETALMFPSDNLRCSKLLLKSGAKINIFNKKYRNGLSWLSGHFYSPNERRNLDLTALFCFLLPEKQWIPESSDKLRNKVALMNRPHLTSC